MCNKDSFPPEVKRVFDAIAEYPRTVDLHACAVGFRIIICMYRLIVPHRPANHVVAHKLCLKAEAQEPRKASLRLGQ